MAKRSEVAFEDMRPYEQALAEISGRTQETDAFAIASSVADRIMSATTLDEVIEAAAQGPEDLTDWVGRAFRFVGSSLTYSVAAEQYREGGAGFYAVFKCVDLNDQEHTISTGAVNVLFQLRAFEKLGVFDGDGLFPDHFTVISRPTGRGTLFRLARS
jgi:hypothetical protein